MPATIINAPTRYLVAVQTVATLLLAGTALGLLGSVFAYSLLAGGLISVVPNAWFAAMVFRHSGARATGLVVRNAFMGELMKLVLIGAGFALVFVLVDPLHVPGLFSGFVLVHLAGLVAMIRHAGLNN
jgi:ATP synthase protein I